MWVTWEFIEGKWGWSDLVSVSWWERGRRVMEVQIEWGGGEPQEGNKGKGADPRWSR